MQSIHNFMRERIILSGRMIARLGVERIQDGDVVLTHGASSVVEAIFLDAVAVRGGMGAVPATMRGSTACLATFLPLFPLLYTVRDPVPLRLCATWARDTVCSVCSPSVWGFVRACPPFVRVYVCQQYMMMAAVAVSRPRRPLLSPVCAPCAG